MAASQAELEKCQRSAIVYNVPSKTTRKEIASLVSRELNLPISENSLSFSDSYNVNGEELKKAYLNFPNKETVDRLMKVRVLNHREQEMQISRYLPKSCPLAGRITTNIQVTFHQNELRKKLNEYDLNQYFEKFGKIIDAKWIADDDRQIILQFEDYDSVDEIILAGTSHTIRNLQVDVEKTNIPTRSVAKSAERPYCIHATNLPPDMTSEELSRIFSAVHVADILFRPVDPSREYLVSDDQSTSEAWLKHLPNRQAMEGFVRKHSGKMIGQYQISLAVVEEPFSTLDLCKDFQTGKCSHTSPSDQCHYKHILCDEPDECENKQCWLGHSGDRSITSDERPQEDLEMNAYRVRVENIPSKTTKEQFLNQLKFRLKFVDRVIFPDSSASNPLMVVYFIKQVSENVLRRKIRDWHNKPFSNDQSTRMKWQLEPNMNFFNWENQKDLPNRDSAMSTVRAKTTTPAPWLNINRSRSSATTDKPADLNKLAPQWYWTGEKMFELSDNVDIYSLATKKNARPTAAIKIYRNNLPSAAQENARREKDILEKLQGIPGIPKLLTSNINNSFVEEPWIIIEYIDGVPLSEFRKSGFDSFRDKVTITLKLLHIIKEMHSRNIVHRYIKPESIIISSQSYDVFLIDLTQACHIQPEKNFVEDIQRPPMNSFYQPFQFENSPSNDSKNNTKTYKDLLSIDTSFICAILFFLITGHAPQESRNIHDEAPHQREKFSSIIDEELTRATGVWTGTTEKRAPLQQHIQLIFDQGFARSQDQWSIKGLNYQLEHILQLTTDDNLENNSLPSPLTEKKISSTTHKPNSILQLISLIDYMRQRFTRRYPDVYWSTDEKCKWNGHSRQVELFDCLTFKKFAKSITIETCCRATMNKNDEIKLVFEAKTNSGQIVILPMGIWKESDREKIYNNFEIELKTLIEIFAKNRSM